VNQTPEPLPRPSVQESGHSHKRYFIAIAAVALITLTVGVGIGLAYQYVSGSASQLYANTKFTFVVGTVSIGQPITGYPIYIYFDTVVGTLSAAIFANGYVYQLYLPSGATYSVSIVWQNTTASSYFSTGLTKCNANPHSFTPYGNYVRQDFSFC